MIRALAGAGVLVAVLGSVAHANVLWRGDFETGALDQWVYKLNPRGSSVVDTPVREGVHAGRIEITPEDLWPNGLNRVELQHKPGERVVEGATTVLGWSVLVPQPLGTGRVQIGYWESVKGYQQMMSFEVRGEHIAFVTRKPTNVVQWQEAGRFTAGVWHDLVMRVLWSVDPAVGRVDVWFDGAQVVTDAPAQTLFDGPNLFQLGILRDDKTAPTGLMYVDRALEATTVDDVLQGAPMPSMPAPPTTMPAKTPGTPAVGGCSVGRAKGGGALLLALLGAWSMRRRRIAPRP